MLARNVHTHLRVHKYHNPRYIRHYFQGGAELSVIMLQAYSYSSNTSAAVELLQGTVLPWVSSMLMFYDHHYPKYDPPPPPPSHTRTHTHSR
jgi:hypothetical protein